MPIPIAAILGGAMMGLGFAQTFPSFNRAISYPVNRLWRNEVLGQGEALELMLREKMGKGDLDFHLGSKGLSKKDIDLLMTLKQQLIDVMPMIQLWRKGDMVISDLNDRAKHLGWTDGDVQLLIKVTEVMPSVSDSIRFQDRGITPDLQAASISPELYDKFWATHWVLPGLPQALEMMQRNIIGSDELEHLLEMYGVMPEWRGKIIELAYNPLPRLVLRQMNKLGILTDAELLPAFRQLGFDETNAQRLTDFTIAYNKKSDAIDQNADDQAKTKEKDLTKADILGGYKDGMFAVSDVTDALTSLGFSQDEVDYYLSRANFERDKDTTNELLKFYEQAYITGIISFNDTTDALNKLGLDGKYVEALFGVWDLKRQARIQKPTKAEILTFLRKKVIDEETAIAELQGLGYQAKYIEWYLQTK